MSQTIILHRTIGSPYAQKAMAMLGYGKADWLSVIANKGMPRPEQEILVGNLARRIPILQIGADLYCDTDMIAFTLAEQLNLESLNRFTLSKEDNEKIWNYDYELLAASLGSAKPINFLTGYFRTVPFKVAIAFFKDRIAMSKEKTGSTLMETKKQEEWIKVVDSYFAKMQCQLEETPYLAGNEPNLVDFSAYTHIFYMQVLNKLKFAKPYPKIRAWLKRMNEIGTGNFTEITGQQALDIANNSEPRPIPQVMQQSKSIGTEIGLKYNDDIGKTIMKETSGILVGEDDYQYILERENETVGTVHIHIPKQCYGACG